jgi:hypothetical protein
MSTVCSSTPLYVPFADLKSRDLPSCVNVALLGPQGSGVTSFGEMFSSISMERICQHISGGLPAMNLKYTSVSCVTPDVYDAVIVLYDMSDSRSFARACGMLKILNKSYPDLCVILVGNKAELDRAIQRDSVKHPRYTEVSAKTGFNMAQPFSMIVDALRK